ncbi:glycerol-3-phosphate acyltransferase 2, mitochondrial isoform X2 [Cuculus canorus]|uniref:glycerol-3-phosphate acyltransferase 2, mitochondrial isoform X2 n=1 Tax=Cuculus canorus TaxID=55661 RepID=UPI0023AAB24E|nr:glycerol-3-phosphate acyltransferase 2, mitochondrial isoform X2 [Cuculus canorus]
MPLPPRCIVGLSAVPSERDLRREKMLLWVSDSGQKIGIFIPFLRKRRPTLPRSCENCARRSSEDFYRADLGSLGFRDALRVTEENTRYRGWLVRRICGLIAVSGWKIPVDVSQDLPERIWNSRRIREITSGRSFASGGDNDSQRRWKEKVMELLAEIHSPLSFFLLRFCHWILLKVLNRLLVNLQVHRGQTATALRATATSNSPLVFLSTHRSQLDGLLLSFVVFSQGMGALRVAADERLWSRNLRAFLKRLGAVFLPAPKEERRKEEEEALADAVAAAYVEEVLRSRQPLLILLEEPSAWRRLSARARRWLAMVLGAVRDGAVPDVLLVPVGISYDVVPGGFRGEGLSPLGVGGCVGAAARALRRRFGCARVDFAQPFSLKEFVSRLRPFPPEPSPEELWFPSALGAAAPDGQTAPEPPRAEQEETEETSIGIHCLCDAISCSAISSVGVTAALLLHRHLQGVLFSRLMVDFVWLLEEILLRQRDVGFSGRLRAVLEHSLGLLGPRVALRRLSALGDALVLPDDSVEAVRELGYHSDAVVTVFGSEAVGGFSDCSPTPLLLSGSRVNRRSSRAATSWKSSCSAGYWSRKRRNPNGAAAIWRRRSERNGTERAESAATATATEGPPNAASGGSVCGSADGLPGRGGRLCPSRIWGCWRSSGAPRDRSSVSPSFSAPMRGGRG